MTMPLLDREIDTEREASTGDGNFAHIVLNREDDVTWAYIERTALEALCGYVWVPSKAPKSKPVCPKCKAVYDDNEAIILANPKPAGEGRARPDDI